VALIKNIILVSLITNPQDFLRQETTISSTTLWNPQTSLGDFCCLLVIISSSRLNFFKGKDTEQKERILSHSCLIRE